MSDSSSLEENLHYLRLKRRKLIRELDDLDTEIIGVKEAIMIKKATDLQAHMASQEPTDLYDE